LAGFSPYLLSFQQVRARAKKRAKAQLQADTDALKKDIDNMRAA
jgi:hypothetical protein